MVAEWEFSPIMLSPCFFFRDLSHEKKSCCLIVILVIVYYNPHMTRQYTRNNRGPFFSLPIFQKPFQKSEMTHDFPLHGTVLELKFWTMVLKMTSKYEAAG